MKNFFLINVLLICFNISGIFAQERVASFSFNEEKFSFGTIKESEGPVNHVFDFINNGGTPLIIQNVVASCGCTTPDWSKNPIPPGGKGFIKATYDPSGRPGPFTKTITVTSNASKQSLELSFNGTVTPKPITLEDQYHTVVGNLRFKSTHASFPNLKPTSIKTDTIYLLNSGKSAISISVTDLPAFIKAVAIPAIVKPSEKGKIIVTYNASKKNDWGFLRDFFYLNINGKQDKSQLITVTSTIEEDFSTLTPVQKANAAHIKFEKNTFAFGSLKEGLKREGTLTFRNTGKSPLNIRRIETSCDCTIAIPSEKIIKPGASAILKISYDSHKQKNEQNKTITITTNDPDNIRTVLYVKGNVE